MAIEITLNFDDTWAARLGAMVTSRLERIRTDPIIVALIDSLPGIDSVDDLTTVQKGKLWILYGLLCDLCRFEGDIAAVAGRQAVVDDIQTSFPLVIGES